MANVTEAAHLDRLPPVIPDHRMLRLIAEGSYGEVWLAKSALGHMRAVKVVRRNKFKDAKPYLRELDGVKRFEPVSREHGNLMDILHVGQDEEEEFFYYVMELADDASKGAKGVPPVADPTGQDYVPDTLSVRIERGPIPASEVAGIGVQLTQALGFLHSKKLVHRDIKPSNIIFSESKPKLADAGMVAELGGALSMVGTLGYMAPEGPGTAAADIYSLGKVLYRAAAGKEVDDFPMLPSRLDPAADNRGLLELNEVLLKACALNPKERYRSAAEMGRDLGLVQDGVSLRQRRLVRGRLRFAARSCAAVAALALLAVAGRQLLRWDANPEPLAEDRFEGIAINTNLWAWSEANFGGTLAERTFRVQQGGGDMSLRATIEQCQDTSSKLGWIDCRIDLRQLGPARIEFETEASSPGGGWAAISFSDGSPPDRWDSASVCLLRLTDFRMENCPTRRIRIDVLPGTKAARVYTDASRTSQHDVLDLSALAEWHLRFFVNASSSSGFPGRETDLRIRDFEILPGPDTQAIAGCVFDAITGRPEKDALIMDLRGAVVARSLASGAFVVEPRPRHALFARKPGFEDSGKAFLEMGPTGFVRLELVRTNFEQGDVVQVLPLALAKEEELTDLAYENGKLLVLSYNLQPNESKLRRLDPDTGRSDPEAERMLTLPELKTIAFCQGRFFGFTAGVVDTECALYDMDAGPPRLFDRLVDPDTREPIFYPQDCAFDGQYLWFVENDSRKDRANLLAYDLATHRIEKCLIARRDRQISGLAWDGSRFWVSSLSAPGRVYAVSRMRALEEASLDAAVGPGFGGRYVQLAFGGGWLWGIEENRRRICKIKIVEPKYAKE